MGYRVTIDKQSCQSSGNCVEMEPAAFGLDADELGDVRPAAAELGLDRLREIAQRCPALAIALFDEAGNEIDVAGG